MAFSNILIASNIFLFKLNSSKYFWSGIPKILRYSNICDPSFIPGNKGERVNNSAIIHPAEKYQF